ncbi:tetratricopeptide repeat protein [Paludisphaera soli]|uniref:tetratricopeptide repeat protein n=1 Tax=Paludisphaera soli TaxID=2712865 RepID=UPI0013ED8462|nr:tetratricopeptide repeat protein [Paludisphaera soli]
MGPKTLRRTAIAAVVLVLGVVSVVLLQRYQVSRLGRSNLAAAEAAEKAGDLAKAEEAYLQHVMVFPQDQDAQVRYAGVLLARSKTPARMGQAIQIYRDVLGRDPGRDDVRRSMAELLMEVGGPENLRDARSQIGVLLRKSPDDGDLIYMRGRCEQAAGDDAEAVESFRLAYERKAKDRFDARQRAASILRDRQNNPTDADKLIDEMVQADPGDYRVYLERGRYRSRNLKAGEDAGPALADFREALKLAPKQAEVYLELSQAALRQVPPDAAEAARVLQQGLEADPKAGRLYLASALLSLRSGDSSACIRTLQKGLEALPDDIELRLTLADLLAQRGATIELRDQVQELRRIGLKFYADYFTAYSLVNARDWAAARKLLLDEVASLDLSGSPDVRAKVNNLLARCYAGLGDVERQRTALASAIRDDPKNVQAKLTWAADLAAQGQVNQAIDEYRSLAESAPTARLPLIQLLIAQNRRIPAAQRDWAEVERLVAQLAKDEPTSSRPTAMQAQVLLGQGRRDEAVALLEAARSKNPRDPDAKLLWVALAEIQLQKKDYPAALRTLDEGRAALGDAPEFRLARVRVVAARGGPGTAAELVALADDVGSVPAESRGLLLETIGEELTRLDARDEAVAVWTRRAELAPKDLRPRLQLLSLALPIKADPTPEEVAKGRKAIEDALAEVRRVEGSEGYMGRYGELEYLLWQAARATDATEKARLRSEARGLLAELRSRRPDWSVVPLIAAKIEEQDLDMAKDEQDKERRIGRAADLYRQAVEMGQRNLGTVKRATELLMAAGRTSEVGPLWSKVPMLSEGSASSSVLERSLLEKSIGDKEYDKAEEVVRQRIAARPQDYSERIQLAQLLLLQKRPDEAEAELRKALADEPTDPNRYIYLVQFLVVTGGVDKAQEVAGQVEKNVERTRAPLTLAACADLIAQGYQAAAQDAPRAKWLATAKAAYGRALAAKPDDFSLRRGYVEFLLRSQLVDDVEKELTAIVKPPADAKAAPAVSAEDLAWAKRTLALTHVARSELGGDYQQALKALYLYAPPDKPEAEAAAKEPQDLRVLARVFEAQKIIPYRMKAIAILEKLKAENQASDDDRFLLGRLYAADGRWDEAHRTYQQLVRDAADPRSSQALNQQVVRIVHFAMQLIARVKSGGGGPDSADAKEAQQLIDRVRKIQPDGFNVLALQCRLDAATGKADAAKARIQEIADRPELDPRLARVAADLAESLGLHDLAEGLFKRNATATARLEDQLDYAAYLGRRGRVKEALDVCEPLWKATPNPEPIAPTVIAVLLSSRTYNDAEQIGRVSGWIERGLQQNPKSPLLTIALATLRDRQQRYDEAVALYRKAVELRGGEVIPLNNLAWLLSLQGEKGAAPLEMINKAIALRGPIPEFLDTRGVVYLNKGESRRAIEDLENAVAIDPSAGRYFHLARAYLEAGDVEAAKRSLAKARDRGLGDDDIHPLERSALSQVEKALK